MKETIFIASDHAGFDLKKQKYLVNIYAYGIGKVKPNKKQG